MRRCAVTRIFNEVNNHKNNNKMNNKIEIQMTKKEEALSYLGKQILDKKASIEYTSNKGYIGTMDEIIIEDKKAEMRTLLNIMNLILEA